MDMELEELKQKYKITDKDFETLSEIYREETVRKIYAEAGKKGGDKNKKKGREYFSRIGKLGAKRRYGK